MHVKNEIADVLCCKDVYIGVGNGIGQQKPPPGYKAIIAIVGQVDTKDHLFAEALRAGLNDPIVLQKNRDYGHYRAVIYVNDQEKRIIVAFRGSDNLENWVVNGKAAAAGFKINEGYLLRDSAKDFVKKVEEKASSLHARYPGYKLAPTGHSLGGSLAQYMACIRNLPANVFASPGIGRNEYREGLGKAADVVNIYGNRDLIPKMNRDGVVQKVIGPVQMMCE